MMTFTGERAAVPRRLVTSQIYLGAHNNLAAQEQRIKISSRMVLRKLSDQTVTLRGVFVYSVSAGPVSVPLPLEPLQPREVRQLELDDLSICTAVAV